MLVSISFECLQPELNSMTDAHALESCQTAGNVMARQWAMTMCSLYHKPIVMCGQDSKSMLLDQICPDVLAISHEHCKLAVLIDILHGVSFAAN